MGTPETERREQSIAEHVRGLSEESAGLVREQAQLIRDDLIDEVKRLGLGGVMLGGAALLGLGAFGALTAALVSAFGGGKRGALTVMVSYGAAAGGLAVAGPGSSYARPPPGRRTHWGATSKQPPRECA